MRHGVELVRDASITIFFLAEIIREKIMRRLGDEVPHRVAVGIERFAGPPELAETWHERSELIRESTLHCRSLDLVLAEELADQDPGSPVRNELLVFQDLVRLRRRARALEPLLDADALGHGLVDFDASI